MGSGEPIFMLGGSVGVPNFSSAILCLFLSLPCAAQDFVPFIRLSPDEVAKAKQLVQSLKDARERSSKPSRLGWQPSVLATDVTAITRFCDLGHCRACRKVSHDVIKPGERNQLRPCCSSKGVRR